MDKQILIWIDTLLKLKLEADHQNKKADYFFVIYSDNQLMIKKLSWQFVDDIIKKEGIKTNRKNCDRQECQISLRSIW